MNPVNKNKVGLVLGAFFGLWHVVWSILVALGWAQPLLNWFFRLHMIEPPFRFAAFDLGLAATLIVVASIIGYIAGYVIGAIWGRVHRA